MKLFPHKLSGSVLLAGMAITAGLPVVDSFLLNSIPSSSWTTSASRLCSTQSSDDGDWETIENADVVIEDYQRDEDEWLPDREKAKQKRENARVYAEKVKHSNSGKTTAAKETDSKPRPSAYTDEEEDVIAAMGGKTHHPQRKRESGFLGDSTLQEITTDYSVPICYIADVLCMWGVTPPINVRDRLGDLVTGEQAFSLLEAVNSLDISALHDRYSNTNLLQISAEWEIDLQKAFEMAMREGWSLPFGVQTVLRVEQEEELIRVLGNPMAMTREGTEDYEVEEDDSFP